MTVITYCNCGLIDEQEVLSAIAPAIKLKLTPCNACGKAKAKCLNGEEVVFEVEHGEN
jgi:hypothetical protein